MATRKTGSTSLPPPLELTIAHDAAKARLQERIAKGMEIKRGSVRSREEYEHLQNEFYKWDAFNTELLKRTFTTTELADEYSHFVGLLSVGGVDTLGEMIADLFKDIDGKIHRIDSIIERLELIPMAGSAAVAESATRSDRPASKVSNKVFVVHGRDEVAKTNLEVFLHENKLEPIVLHRQADEGMTIIEKFEKHGDVGYAFILLTPDEIAYLAAEEVKPDAERRKEFRARPNVIFEFGYFVGRLGRARVCCLYTGDVVIPSDLSGMVYKRYERSIEEVAYPILKDLRASGYNV
ncbi:nucleotide-binding protein [Variovorax ureilyticus]|uniref:Nucleotide-binding protein n=1 Tax=Variovorax ureilyticus TaxID=1836198 RepID=A0ABU8V7Y2_9BURK